MNVRASKGTARGAGTRADTVSLVAPAALFIAIVGVGGCGETFTHLTASFGGDDAGDRGAVRVLFINNTPHRAVFTFGSYDQTDPSSQPDFEQFGSDDDGLTLEGDSESAIGSINCARVFSIGGPRLLALIQENLPDAELEAEALIEGVGFFRTDPQDEGGEAVSKGKAPPFEALLGVDFPCNALLIFRLEIDDLGSDPFRIDFELIPSESTR